MKFLLILIILISGCASNNTLYMAREKIIPASIEYQPSIEKKEIVSESKINNESENTKSTIRVTPLSGSAELLPYPSSPPRPTSITAVPAPAPANNVVEQSAPKTKSKTVIAKDTVDKKLYESKTKSKADSKIVKDTVASQLYEASAAFTVPNKANISQDIKAELIIDPAKTLADLKKSIKGQIQSLETIKVSKIVIAKIDAPDFIVSELTSTDQALSSEGKTTWIWNLRPKSSGLHEINLTVLAEVTIGNKQTKYHIRTFDKQIMIEITPIQIVKEWWIDSWQWIISTLILPLIIYIYSKFKSKKSKDHLQHPNP